MEANRETFGSRIGFLLISAGCAIGLGNVWKFPYITGKYGGAAFVLIYFLFLLIMGIPVLTMELAVGRASKRSVALSMDVLEPKGSKWHWFKFPAMAGNYILMMFYTTVAGWMLYYFCKMAAGGFCGMSAEEIGATFNNTLASPGINIAFMAAVVISCMLIVGKGLQDGVEKITKVMMLALLALMIILAVRSVFLAGGEEGLRFYLYPDFSKLREYGITEVLFAAMSQAFFTLSIGMGAMAIFGSYIDRSHALMGEAVCITVLDTSVALMAGLIIFPACFAYGVDPGQGPGLIFVTLPNVFNAMPGGRLWGALFFLFMCFAAFSTVIAVFQNLIAFWTDMTEIPKKKIVRGHIVAMILLSLPCALGYNLLSGIQPLGAGTAILDLEDFLVSNNILPLGGIVYVLFCACKSGWGWENALEEANAGKGLKFPNAIRLYVKYVLPLIILFVFVMGYISMFGK